MHQRNYNKLLTELKQEDDVGIWYEPGMGNTILNVALDKSKYSEELEQLKRSGSHLDLYMDVYDPTRGAMIYARDVLETQPELGGLMANQPDFSWHHLYEMKEDPALVAQQETELETELETVSSPPLLSYQDTYDAEEDIVLPPIIYFRE
jgi:hypothetical protein